jgi:hypothetical protein
MKNALDERRVKDETFERVADHLYRRQYKTATGQWRTMFYGIFTD